MKVCAPCDCARLASFGSLRRMRRRGQQCFLAVGVKRRASFLLAHLVRPRWVSGFFAALQRLGSRARRRWKGPPVCRVQRVILSEALSIAASRRHRYNSFSIAFFSLFGLTWRRCWLQGLSLWIAASSSIWRLVPQLDSSPHRDFIQRLLPGPLRRQAWPLLRPGPPQPVN